MALLSPLVLSLVLHPQVLEGLEEMILEHLYLLSWILLEPCLNHLELDQVVVVHLK